MQARARFMLAVVVLFLLMTGPFLLTALIVWLETEGEARDLLVRVLSPHLTLGTLLTAMGFAAGVGVVRVLFRQYVQGLLRMSENLRLMLGANRGFRVQPEGPPEVQQLAVAANELASQRDALLDGVERMRDQVALEDTVDRAPEADQLTAAGHAGRLGERAELRARAVVVEQHAAVEVAHHHALRQLGHQRREAILLELDRLLGAPDLGRDVAHQLVALAGELVHRQRQGLHLGRAFGLDAEPAVGTEHQAQVL